MRAHEFLLGYGYSTTSGLNEILPALDRGGSHRGGRYISTLILRGSFYVGIVRTPQTTSDQAGLSRLRRTKRGLGAP